MPTTTRYGFPYPALSQSPRVSQDVGALATAIDSTLFQVRGDLATATSNALSQALAASSEARSFAATGINDARNLQASTAVATGSVTVTTAQQGVPGGALQLPADVSAIAIATYDVACDAWNGLSAFEGRLGFIRLSDGADQGNAAGPALYAAGVVNGRTTVVQTYTLGSVNFGRTLQLRVTKSTTSAGYVTSPSTTKLTVLRLRSGVL